MMRGLRLLSVCYWLLSFFIRGWLMQVFIRDKIKRRHRQSRLTTITARHMLKSFHIKVNLRNPERLQLLDKVNGLIVSNHVSYLDIIVLASCYPMVFITSLEMAANPILGDITRLGGSLFTNRKKRTTLPAEIANFTTALKEGFNVVLFAEGTSTNGASVYPFKKSLFQAAVNAEVDILPCCVRYAKLDGIPITSQPQRDIICWYATTTFLPHFWKLLKHDVEAEVSLLEPIHHDPKLNRQQLSELTHESILSAFFQS